MTRLLTALLIGLPLAAGAQDAAAGAPGDPPAPAPAEALAPAAHGAAPGRVYAGIGMGPTLLSRGGESGGTAYRLRLGMARSPRTTLGLEAGFTSSNARRLTWYDVGATFFPWGKYLYLRGAVGLTVSTGRELQSDQGLNALVGVGAALGRPRGLTVTINVDAQNHGLSGGTERVNTVAAWLGLDWY